MIPFALATVVGGIDCTESAAAAGDEYDTRQVIGVEGVATLLAAVCGGVVQTTPYIGHPAYKAMGGRSAYTLATALFVGGAGLLGYFGYLYLVIPKAAIFPILIFIGLEITAQSFHATPATALRRRGAGLRARHGQAGDHVRPFRAPPSRAHHRQPGRACCANSCRPCRSWRAGSS